MSKANNSLTTDTRKKTRTHGPNSYTVDGDVAKITLTDKFGDVAGYALVDAKYADAVVAVGRWNLERRKNTNYALTHVKINGQRMTIFMHRVVAELAGNNLNGLVVDHLRHDGLDNRIAELDVVPKWLNDQRRNGAASNSKTGIRGVVWNVKDKKFQAKISADGAQIGLGFYDAIEDATAAAIEGRLCLMPMARFTAEEMNHQPSTMSRWEMALSVATRLAAWQAKHGRVIQTTRIEAILTIAAIEKYGGVFVRDVEGRWTLQNEKSVQAPIMEEALERKTEIVKILDETRPIW